MYFYLKNNYGRMMGKNNIFLGLYEKALPEDLDWEERFELAKKAGFMRKRFPRTLIGKRGLNWPKKPDLISWKFLLMNPTKGWKGFNGIGQNAKNSTRQSAIRGCPL